MLKPIYIEARDLPDAWFLALYNLFIEGFEYTISRGSYKGQKRLEYDFAIIRIRQPGNRPLWPDIPPGINVPAPVDETFVNNYLNKLITSVKSPNEDYVYGQDLGKQIPEVIGMYKNEGHNTNQAFMAVGNSDSIFLGDPQCLRGIDTRIRYGKLHFVVYFRSWELWGGFPANLAAIQLLKEYMAREIGVEDGEIIALSKGLHLYDHCWEVAKIRTGWDKRDPSEKTLLGALRLYEIDEIIKIVSSSNIR